MRWPVPSSADLQARLNALKLPVSGSIDPNLPFPQQQRKLLAGLQRSEAQIQARPLRLAVRWGAMLASGLRVLPRSRGHGSIDSGAAKAMSILSFRLRALLLVPLGRSQLR